MKFEYRICSRCIMDTSDMNIHFDAAGICNHCHARDELMSTLPQGSEALHLRMQGLLNKIKNENKQKEYDCLIGISGGVDSSFLVHKMVEAGLRPLLVHIDNGWNSELAVTNIQKLISKLNLDLVTYVVDWEEFRDIQKSIFKSSVLDLELLSDQVIVSVLFKTAKKHGIKYILSGHNLMTETHLPSSWTWMKFDAKNIRAIHKQYGRKTIKRTPLMGILSFILNQKMLGYKFAWPLNFLEYDKDAALKLLRRNYDWQEYAVKHGESVITRFYQCYILPKKFKVDKRRSHYSSLVCSGQITRADALKLIAKPTYSSEELEIEKEFFIKKLDLDEAEFDEIMQREPVSHLAFASEYKMFLVLRKFKRLIYSRKLPVYG